MPNPLFTRALPLILATLAVAQDGQSTFGHARARELAGLGVLPTAREVVVRDLVNYHRHRLPLPRADQDVALELRADRVSTAAESDTWLQVGYTTPPQGDRALAPPCAVALVVDCSGSMAAANKMTAVRHGLRAFAERLRADDELAVVTFSTEARVLAPRQRLGDGRWLHDAIDRLSPEGNTNLHAGLMLGIDQLQSTGISNRRVVLLTDGIANTGVTHPDQILADAAARAEITVDITTIGVGEDLDVPLLQRLAAGARGLFHFVGDPQDVQKVFVREADSLLHPVARRVHLELELPRDVTVQQVLHEGANVTEGRIDIALPDLNAGATGVVVLRLRGTPGRDSAPVRATLSFDSARERRPIRERATVALVTSSSPTTPDVELRKNAAIAVLAQGLADMAAAADARRWADADRRLLFAREQAQRLFPGQDADLQRVRDIADSHARTLRRYVDRFRDG